MCFHNARITHENSNRRDIDFCALKKTEFHIEDVISNSWFIPTQSVVFRSKYVKEMPIWTRYVFGGDMVLYLILSTFGKFRYLDEILSVYRRQKTGLSQINSPFYVENKIIESLCYFNLYTQFKYNNMIQNRIKLLREGLPMSYLKGFWISRKVLLPLYHFFK